LVFTVRSLGGRDAIRGWEGVRKYDRTYRHTAAAAAVYLGYRHMEADIICTGAGVVGSCVGEPGAPATKLSTEGIDVLVMGARVLF
jgi:hypothetical protein